MDMFRTHKKRNGIWRFKFEFSQPGAAGADGDSLKHTQEAGGTNRESPQYFVKEDNHSTVEVTWDIPCPQTSVDTKNPMVRSIIIWIIAKWVMVRSMSLGLDPTKKTKMWRKRSEVFSEIPIPA